MARSFGLDVGLKTIGVAMSDPMGWTAQGLTTVRRTNLKADLAALQLLVTEHGVERFVIGLPRNMDGSIGPQAEQVQAFADKLVQTIPLPIDWIDERLSTRQAQQAMIDAGMRRAKRKEKIDETAAMVILQVYLDRQRFN